MFFKNAMIYRLTQPLITSADELLEMLDNRAFVPCTGMRPSSFGWVSPLGDIENAPLMHEVGGCYLLCARREEKVVPPSALNEIIEEKIAKIEAVEARKIRAKEKLSIKENALAELLPRALARSKQVMGYISPKDDLLVIGTSAPTEAEMFINCVRDSIGSFSVTPPQVKQKPQDVFTRWLVNRQLPTNFSFGDQCDLLDIEETSTVSCRRQDLETQEIRQHLEAGKVCTRLGIRWHGDLKCAVDKDLILKQLKLESLNDDNIEDEDPIAKLDAAFVNMTLELRRFLPELMDAFGGETRAAK
ncbi:MAG: recombination associated protein RdgC [Patiriisocius sp.]|jgi:recombination associated protein RdgC